MHSLETGIIVSIAAFFFISFLMFTFLREQNISREIQSKAREEYNEYSANGEKKYRPELINNILNIIIEGGLEYVGEDEE